MLLTRERKTERQKKPGTKSWQKRFLTSENIFRFKKLFAVYCVERDTLYREIRKGKIPSVNLGTKQLRLNRADLEQRYQRRKKVKKAAQKPIPKTYNLEPENCYISFDVFVEVTPFDFAINITSTEKFCE